MLRRRLRSLGILALAASALAVAPGQEAEADTIFGPSSARTDYVPFDELSYEVIIEPTEGYAADMRLRIALHNTSSRAQDVVLNLALPRGANLRGLAVVQGGKWTSGEVTGADDVPGRRDPGTVFVRAIPPTHTRGLPSAQVVGFSLDSGSTTQIELQLDVYPTLSDDRWGIELPRRNSRLPNLSSSRRILVKGLPRHDEFWVENQRSGKSKVLESNANDTVLVSWPARVRGGPTLDGRYEITPSADGKGGDLRLFMRLGQSKTAQPDHLILVVDRSQSASDRLHEDASKMFTALLDSLPEKTTFDAIAFNRHAQALMDSTKSKSRDGSARARLRGALAKAERAQGSDLKQALDLVGQRLSEARAKRPMVVVVTDGMLPMTIEPKVIDESLRAQLGKERAPELLFIVDDPILARRGLSASHPVSTLAAGLGARISLSSLSNLHKDDLDDLLAAPRVLGDLSINLPARVTLLDDVPSGLVAGNFLVLEGRYEGRAPSSIAVSGRFGNRKHATRFRPRRRAPSPQALVASTVEQNLEQAIDEGLTTPDWYVASMRRETNENLTQAGLTGFEQVGQLDSGIFDRSIRFRVLPRVRACYNQALTRNQVQGGNVVLGMEVGKGEVMYATVLEENLERPDPTFSACLEEAAWAMDVPAGQLDGQVYMIRYPLTLTPPEGGKPPSTDPGDDPVFRMLMERADILSQ